MSLDRSSHPRERRLLRDALSSMVADLRKIAGPRPSGRPPRPATAGPSAPPKTPAAAGSSTRASVAAPAATRRPAPTGAARPVAANTRKPVASASASANAKAKAKAKKPGAVGAPVRRSVKPAGATAEPFVSRRRYEGSGAARPVWSPWRRYAVRAAASLSGLFLLVQPRSLHRAELSDENRSALISQLTEAVAPPPPEFRSRIRSTRSRRPRAPLRPLLETSAATHQIPVRLLEAVIAVESGFNPSARSPRARAG